LRVKETDRIAALEAELSKFGVKCSSTIDTLSIEDFGERKKDILLNTYQDHRMAMAFVPMALYGGFYVENPSVVSKSYTAFWEDMRRLGLEIKK
jgi:3-phosphoshikimate 1-carboxyvinyltransferase